MSDFDPANVDPDPAYETLGEFDEEVRRLAALPDHEYDRCRKAEAKRLGVRVGTLDRAVKLARAVDDASAGQGLPIELLDVEPWPEPVDGAELVADLVAQIRRFVVLDDHAALAVALWCIFAHAHEAAFHSPRLAVLSPTYRCGKSTLLRVIGMLVVRKVSTSSVTASATFRLIESAGGPVTLLIDELDNVDPEKASELKAIINAGHCRLDAYVTRTVPVAGDLVVRQFSCWAPTVLAAVKTMPVAWIDRSVTVRMTRKTAAQRVERLRDDKDLGFDALASRAARWAADHLHELRGADPDLSAALDDRACDNWRMLVAIADLGGCGAAARGAASALADAETDEKQALGETLLHDVRAYFDQTGKDRAPSLHLVAWLNDLEGRPWHEYSRGNPMSRNQLARLLHPFGIHPGTIRVDDPVEGSPTTKGYLRRWFESAWEQYSISSNPNPSETVTTSQAKPTAGFSDFQNVTKNIQVTVWNRPKPAATADCDVVTVKNPSASKEYEYGETRRRDPGRPGHDEAGPAARGGRASSSSRTMASGREQLGRGLSSADAHAAKPKIGRRPESAGPGSGNGTLHGGIARGALIREAREAKGWSQSRLAKEAGTAQATVSRAEHGKDVGEAITARILRALAAEEPASPRR